MSTTTAVPVSANFKIPPASILHKVKHLFALTHYYRDYALSDLGNARMFADIFREALRYNMDTEKWLGWCGHTWRELHANEVIDYAALMLDLQRHQIDQETASTKEGLSFIALMRTFNSKSQSHERIRAMLKLAAAQPHFRTTNAHWNQNDYLLATPNGVIDLRTGEFGPGKLKDFVSKSIPVEWDENATAPRFEKFLSEVLPDANDAAFIRRALGYSITGDTSEQIMFFALGEGSNGKSKLLEIVAKILGGYAHVLNLAALDDRNSSSIPNDLAQLGGKRFVIGSETKSSSRFNEAKVKMLTGEAEISVRFLHKEFFNLRNQSHFWAGVNHLPAVQDATDGYWRRIRIIEFNTKFSEEKMDKHLPEKLWAERAGILKWLVAGCLEWQRVGLAAPEHIRARTAQYRDDNDRVGQFLQLRTRISPELEIGVTCLFKEFEKFWKSRYHEECLNWRVFNAALRKRGFETRKNNVTLWCGIGLEPE